MLVGFIVSGPVSGALSDRFGARAFATGGMLLTTIGFLLLTFLPGDFAAIPGKLDLTISLTRINMPFLLLVAIAAAYMGMLNALRPVANGAGVYGPGGQSMPAGPSRHFLIG